MAEIEVMARVERPRDWSDAERAALLAELDVPGSTVPIVVAANTASEVPPVHGVRRSGFDPTNNPSDVLVANSPPAP